MRASSLSAGAALVVISAIFASLAPGVLAQASRFTKKTGYTLQEDVLIIDVASLVGVSAPLATETFDDCLDYCLNTPGCNSADFCSSASGCGEYCIDHNTRNPALTTNPSNPSTPNPAWKLPITGLGPFGPTSKCQGDKWPVGHCSLKTTKNVLSPKFWQAATDPKSAGYVSAWLTTDLPTACKGISPKACYACQSLSSAAEISSCMSCARAMTPDPTSLESFYVGPNRRSKAETCAACYKNATNPAACTKCLGTVSDVSGDSCVTTADPAPPPALGPSPNRNNTPVVAPSVSPALQPPSVSPSPAPAPTSTNSAPSSGTSIVPIAAGVAAGLVAAAALATVLLFMRRRNDADAKPDAAVPPVVVMPAGIYMAGSASGHSIAPLHTPLSSPPPSGHAILTPSISSVSEAGGPTYRI